MKKNIIILRSCLLVTFLFAVSGCGNTETTSNGDLSIADINSASDEKTMVQLIEAWEESTGEICELSDLYVGASLARDGILCDTSSSHLWLYPSASEVKRDLNGRDEFWREHSIPSDGEPNPQLVGPNWLVSLREDENWALNMSADTVNKKMQQKLGGVLVISGE